jgi:dihydrofolate reductase
MGSGVLVQALMKHNLVDEFVLLIHPLCSPALPSRFWRSSTLRTALIAREELT